MSGQKVESADRLDTLTLVETPEGIDLHAGLVGPVARTLAFVVDLLIRFAVVIALWIVLLLLGLSEFGYGVYLIGYFILEWWYPVFFEVYRNGQTPGKKAFNIKVVNEDLTPIGFGPSLIRNLLRTVDFLPVFYAFAYLSMVMNNKFQRLGDLAAKSVVIYDDTNKRDTSSLENIQAIAPNMMLSAKVQTAIIDFSLNQRDLSVARQAELAEILEPYIPKNVNNKVEYIKGIGKWLLGSR